MKKVFFCLLFLLSFAKSTFAANFNFATNLSNGMSVEVDSQKAIIDKLDNEFGSYKSFPGLNAFFEQDLGYTSENCVRLKPQFIMTKKEFMPTGIGAGDVEMIYTASVQCAWNYMVSKSYKVNIGYASEGAKPEITSIVPIN